MTASTECDRALSLTFEKVGRKCVAVVAAKLGDEVLGVQQIDLAKPAQRDGLREAICKGRPGIDPKAVDQELLRRAESLLKQGGREPDAAQPAAPVAEEVEAPSIVRPEQIIHPNLSAFAVPTTISLPHGLESLWEHYLRWSDGRREKRACDTMIALPGNAKLWVHPTPSDPPINNYPAWSRKARVAWLAGAASPAPGSLFRRLCERLGYFVDLPRSRGPGITATVVLWIILTYCYQAWGAVPYLFVGGPLGSGKSRFFEVLLRLVFRPLASSNLTAAALFRTLHAQGGTLLLDEAERLRNTQSPDVQEISSMLLAGYKRGALPFALRRWVTRTRQCPLTCTVLRHSLVSLDFLQPSRVEPLA